MQNQYGGCGQISSIFFTVRYIPVFVLLPAELLTAFDKI